MPDIHLNIDLHKTDAGSVSIVTTRLWSFIPPSLNWLIRAPTPALNSIQGGLSLMIINSLAILVEGFITDILIAHLSKGDLLTKTPKIMALDTATWGLKKKMFNDVFQRDLTTYSEYKSIEALFNLRNNLSHGRSHAEVNTRDIQSGEISPIESMNRNYQAARLYLVGKKLLAESSDSSNTEVIWKFNIALFFFWEVRRFLFNVIESIELNGKVSILSELQTAYEGSP